MILKPCALCAQEREEAISAKYEAVKARKLGELDELLKEQADQVLFQVLYPRPSRAMSCRAFKLQEHADRARLCALNPPGNGVF